MREKGYYAILLKYDRDCIDDDLNNLWIKRIFPSAKWIIGWWDEAGWEIVGSDYFASEEQIAEVRELHISLK